ncbi:MAG: tyrosine-type recombinase/integrase [Bacillota bacterium]
MYSTYRNYKVMIRNHLNPEIGDMKLKNLKSYHIQQLLNEKFENGKVSGEGGLSERTVEYIYITLHAALEKAVKDDLIVKNVSEGVDLPKDNDDLEKDKLHTWNRKQVNKFLEVAVDQKYFILHLLALKTGMRQGELLGLKWEYINLDRNRLDVKQQLARTDEGLIFKKVKTKSGNRTIPITDDVVNELKRHKIEQNENKLALGETYNDNDLVGCNSIGNPIDHRNLVRDFKKAVEKAELPEIRYHDLRHTFATNFLETGGDITVLQRMLGHSSITVTIDTYSHITEDMLNSAAENMKMMYKKQYKEKGKHENRRIINNENK